MDARPKPLEDPSPPSVAAGLDMHQLTLGSLVTPLWLHYGFDALAGVCALLLGHPVVALLLGFGAAAADTLFQLVIRRWMAAARVDESLGLRKLSALSAARVCVYVLPAFAMAKSGGAGELIYYGVQGGAILAAALAAGSLSRLLFWSFAAPALVGFALLAALRLELAPAAGVVLGLVHLGVLLAMISEGRTRAIKGWHAAFHANLAMMHELAAARDRAEAERAAADQAREEARRATLAKSNFLATMSHEIRTPMNGVLGMAQLLRRAEKDPVQLERIDTLIDSGEYLLSILNDILDVSKIDAGRLKIVRGVEDLRLFLDRLVGFWGARAQEKGVALTLTVDDSLPDFVWMDALRLRQVMFNLIGNALKFTTRGSVEVVAQAWRDDAGAALLQLSVRDTGPGIAPEHLPTLFDRFSQVEGDTRSQGGTGLGLAIVKQLSELMGGRVWVESEVGRGSTFHVELPLELAQSERAAPRAAAPVEAAAPPLEPLRILAVDDNAVNLMVLDQLFSSFGHQVTRAASGAEALRLLSAQAFDLVLMDIQMPGMSGVQALQQLRAAAGPNQAVPVIALTADVTSGGRQRYLDLGFTEHGSKPFQVQELLEAVERAMAAPPQSLGETTLSAGAGI